MPAPRSALLPALLLLLLAAGCSSPSVPPPTPVDQQSPTARPTPAQTPQAIAAPALTAAPTPTPPPPAPTVAPEPLPTAAPAPTVMLDVRVWNGLAEVQVDGSSVSGGSLAVEPGTHRVSALVGGEIVAEAPSPPDGGLVDLTLPAPLPALAVVVENQEDARPQSGLLQADVVYEVLAEGGITRFLAVYLSGDAPVVGPVRSLRHYFAFLAGDFGADLIHIGASPQGFAWRDAMKLGKLDESAGDPGVWRVRTRRAPHNAYTDTAGARGLLAARGQQQRRSWGPLRFMADLPADGQPVDSVSLSFRPWAYRVSYTWDPIAGHYPRVMEGRPHRDAETGEQIAPTSVVIQYAWVTAIPNDPAQRLEVDLSGGRLLVFSQGTLREGTWTKAGPSEPTRWLDQDGNRVVLPPGPVWVEVLPQTGEIELK